jgi:hypothetical protein
LDLLKDRPEFFPQGFLPVCLFRNPVDQIESYLFGERNWIDPWSPRDQFWDAIKAYRDHFLLCERVRAKIPQTVFVKIEDVLENHSPFLSSVYGNDAASYETFASSVAPPDLAASGELFPKEITWIKRDLSDVMEALGYGG